MEGGRRGGRGAELWKSGRMDGWMDGPQVSGKLQEQMAVAEVTAVWSNVAGSLLSYRCHSTR